MKAAILHVISLAQYATAYTRSWAANCQVARVRLRAQNDQLKQLVALLTEELRIKDERMRRIPPHKRPHYLPTERMSILELRAARAWSTQQTADVFHVTPATIASWMKRLVDHGPDALVQIREPVNKYPEFVRYAVQHLKTLCPNLGRIKIAEMLCRAGLHLGATTVGRILKEPPQRTPRENPHVHRPCGDCEATEPCLAYGSTDIYLTPPTPMGCGLINVSNGAGLTCTACWAKR